MGISGAIFLGEQWRILDPIAGMLVSLLIIKVAYDLAKPSMDELLEKTLPEEVCNTIKEIISSNPQVVDYHKLRTRKIGNNFAIDVHILLNKNMSFEESHNITNEIEIKMTETFGANTHITIHAEPVE